MLDWVKGKGKVMEQREFLKIIQAYRRRLNIAGFLKILLFALVAVIAGLAGKVIGCGLTFKAFRYSWRESAIGGVGMMARGEVALIVTQTVTATALGANALGNEFMIMTVLLILASSILTPILLKVLYKGVKEAPAHADLIDPDD